MGSIVQVNDNGFILSFFNRRKLRRALKDCGFTRLFWSRPTSEVYRKGDTEAKISSDYVCVPRYEQDSDAGPQVFESFYQFGVQFSGEVEPELNRRLDAWFRETKSEQRVMDIW